MKKENLKLYHRGMFQFRPKAYQLDFAYDAIHKHRIVGVFCRQSGKSEETSKVAIIRAERKKNADGKVWDNYNVLIFAPTDRQTGLIADKIRASIRKMPFSQSFHIVKENQREFEFSNGARIICETTGDKGETIRGYTAHCIILEEAGSIKDSIIQEVILPMGSTTNADVIKIGTPRGKNHFYESSVDPSYAVHQYDYTYPIRDGLITAEYVEEMRRTLPDIIFRTELGAEFIEDQDAYFGYELIETCKDDSLTWDKYIPKQGAGYYIGCDIARLGQDTTAITIVEVENGKGKVVQIVERNKTKLDEVLEVIATLIEYYKPRRVFIDETGLGAGVSDMLSKRYNVPKLQQGNAITKFPHSYAYGDKIVGVKFTIQSKLDMYSNLKVLMQNSKVSYPNHPKLIAQLRDFRYELTENNNVKLHHSKYGFDDFVDSLALAAKEVNVLAPAYAF